MLPLLKAIITVIKIGVQLISQSPPQIYPPLAPPLKEGESPPPPLRGRIEVGVNRWLRTNVQLPALLFKDLKTFILLIVSITLTSGLWLTPTLHAQGPSLHPTFPLLDANGDNVLDSGLPLSTMTTCGGCHDTEYIENHSFHSTLGLDDMTAPGETASGRAWDMSPGPFGQWSPFIYRYLTPATVSSASLADEISDETAFDLGLADWIQTIGARHPGGGPALRTADGTPLSQLNLNTAPAYQTYHLNPETGQPELWDWAESGTVELNCFLCHLDEPNNNARLAELTAGRFAWANTATLLDTGILGGSSPNFTWNEAAFDETGELLPEFSAMQDPSNGNCALCHGLIHTDLDEPLIVTGGDSAQWHTETTGQVMSPQRMRESGSNLADKNDLSRAWDVHTARRVDCVDCHHSLNNPIYYRETDETRPDHLEFDARRLDIGDYLLQPSHLFARGQSAQNNLAPELKDTMRRCESCHNAEATHDWLPYKEGHFEALSCETCHVPQLHAPAVQQLDWTLISPAGEPQRVYRGIDGPVGEISSLITGYEPILLARQNVDGDSKLAPYNLVSAWFWVAGQPEQPVRLVDLQAAFLTDTSPTAAYRPEILAVFDADGDGQLSDTERRVDSEAKTTALQAQLTALGLDNPRIKAEVQPYSINHNVTNGEWVTADCAVCHHRDSLLAQPMTVAAYLPGGVQPTFVQDVNVSLPGDFTLSDSGGLQYSLNTAEHGLYILGYNSVLWIDWFGALALLGTLLGITLHGGGRVWASMRLEKQHSARIERVYMYGVYERLWHWLQALAILLLVFTGLIIHRPDMFGFLDFGFTVLVHNFLGFTLLINAFLAVFYHLASGEIKQYLPQPRGFFNQAVTQAMYYLRGIFEGAEHPYEKTPEKKLNPLQQLTYFGILNVLLPVQIITGVMIWGLQRWPALTEAVGGLPLLAPVHTLAAWLFVSFIVMHIYLTTTGHTPTANIKAMVVGWDEVEVYD